MSRRRRRFDDAQLQREIPRLVDALRRARKAKRRVHDGVTVSGYVESSAILESNLEMFLEALGVKVDDEGGS